MVISDTPEEDETINPIDYKKAYLHYKKLYEDLKSKTDPLVEKLEEHRIRRNEASRVCKQKKKEAKKKEAEKEEKKTMGKALKELKEHISGELKVEFGEVEDEEEEPLSQCEE